MLKKFVIFSVLAFSAFVVYKTFLVGPRPCLYMINTVSIDSVVYREFSETIPFNGVATYDSISKREFIKAEIDELYFSRVTPGLKATTTINGNDHWSTLTSKDTVLNNGRFTIQLVFDEQVSQAGPRNKALRMRLNLSGPVNAITLSVGGFYKDSGGKFVYVVLKDGRAVKRNVVLGRKNPNYFEVISGLTPGELVVTSPYEMFGQKDTVTLEEIKKLYE